MISTFIADVRYGTRLLRQSPVFSAVAVVALALGIGAAVAALLGAIAALACWLPARRASRLDPIVVLREE